MLPRILQDYLMADEKEEKGYLTEQGPDICSAILNMIVCLLK